LEGIFKIEGKAYDVMIDGNVMKWSPVSISNQEEEVETFEINLIESCIGLRIRKIKSLKTHRSILGFWLKINIKYKL